MTIRNWGPVRDCMQTTVTEVDGRLDVLSALKVMKKAFPILPSMSSPRTARRNALMFMRSWPSPC
jgi:hypothetical protein